MMHQEFDLINNLTDNCMEDMDEKEIEMTSLPTTDSELQLFRLLQRANLLSYYDIFIRHGGDDVLQLYEARDDEFLEIMAMVEMVKKPLHVRRLQKVLREWYNNPAEFQTPLAPLVPISDSNLASQPIINCPLPIMCTNSSTTPGTSNTILSTSNQTTNSTIIHKNVVTPQSLPSTANLPQLGLSGTLNSIINKSQNPPLIHPCPKVICKSPTSRETHQSQPNNSVKQTNGNSILPTSVISLNNSNSTFSSNSDINNRSLNNNENIEHLDSNSPICMTSVLTSDEKQKLSEAAFKVISKATDAIKEGLKNIIPRKLKEVQHVINMAEDDPRKLEGIRKYAPIYGRYDCKRKPEKPLSMHEVFTNEAAIHLCKLKPLLLSNRKLLFDLAREAVKISGYQYSKGHSRSNFNLDTMEFSFNQNSNSNSQSLPENNNDVDVDVDVETFKEDKTTNSSESNNLNNSNDSHIKEDKNSYEEEFKRFKDQNDIINEQIKLKNCEIDELRTQKKCLEENESNSRLNKLNDEKDLLIQSQNELLNSLQKLEKSYLSPKRSNISFVSEYDDDTSSQISNYSNTSSKDENLKLISSQFENQQNSNFAPTSLKRKLLKNISPQKNKIQITEKNYKKTQSKNCLTDNEDTEIEQDEDDDNHGVDLRVSYSNFKNKFN